MRKRVYSRHYRQERERGRKANRYCTSDRQTEREPRGTVLQTDRHTEREPRGTVLQTDRQTDTQSESQEVLYFRKRERERERERERGSFNFQGF